MELDAEQREAVESEDSMICIAGPGSGKTRVLTEKARRLFERGENILCLTFTRSAAREMASRVEGLPATTIHSYCCGNVGWKDDWGYSGLLFRFLRMPDKLRYGWVLLDECQDVNEVELDVVLSLVGDRIFAVGDPYQSIYGFQGALGWSAVNLLSKISSRHELHNNYRSCPRIVDRLNGIYNRSLVSRNIKETGLTAILCRTNDDLLEVSRFLKDKGVSHGVRLGSDIAEGKRREYNVVGESNIRLMTIHSSKGHEFDRVFVYNWRPQNVEEEEQRVYYVAMARASKEFTEMWSLSDLLLGLQ